MIRVSASVGVIGAGIAGALAVGVTTGVSLGGFGWWMSRAIGAAYQRMAHGSPDAIVARLPLESGEVLPVRRKYLGEIRLSAPHGAPRRLDGRSDEIILHVTREVGPRKTLMDYTFEGERARRAAGIVLPAINARGANSLQVADAVRMIEDSSGDAADLLRLSSSRFASIPIAQLPIPIRLALEMAAHEESERRAMEGELALLEAAWREAEEIAAISDNLLVPPAVDEFLARNRKA